MSLSPLAYQPQGRALWEAMGRAPLILKGGGVVEAAQARLFNAADVDGDGALKADELAGLGGQTGKFDPALIAALDADRDGKLNLGELRSSKLFTREGLDALLAAQGGVAGYLFDAADQDGDGAVTGEEFRAVGPDGRWAAPQQPTNRPEMQILSRADRAFFQGDADADGKLTRAEMQELVSTAAVLQPVFRTLDPTRAAEALMGRADADHSGGLSLAEAQEVAGPKVDVQALFQDVDASGDRELTLDEMQAAIGRHAEFFRTGLGRLDDAVSPGETALMRLFRQTVDRLADGHLAQRPSHGSITA